MRSPFVDFIDESPESLESDYVKSLRPNCRYTEPQANNEMELNSPFLASGEMDPLNFVTGVESFDEGYTDRYENIGEQSEDLYEEEILLNELSEENGEVFFNNEYLVDPSKGVTDLLNVSAVRGHALKTGIFIPSHFTKSNKVNIVVYMHGLFGDGNKSNGIEYYWKTYSNIREYFWSSGRNAILIAPTLTSNPQNANVLFHYATGLDFFLTSCLGELRSRGFIPATANFDQIILAGHSAGGKPLSNILSLNNQYLNNVIECWGFDCIYSKTWGTNISGWAKGNKKFYHYWATDKVWNFAQPFGSSNPNFINTPSSRSSKVTGLGSPHRDIIGHAWINEINKRSWFKAGSPGMGITPSAPVIQTPSQPVTGSTVSPVSSWANAIRLNRYYQNQLGWASYMDQINDFLLPYSGMQNVSLGEEAFAQALQSWQRSQGFSVKDSDGILGPNTWQRLKALLSVTSSPSVPQRPTPTTPSSTSPSSTSSLAFTKYPLSTSPIIIQARDSANRYAEVRESPEVFLKAIVRSAGEDPQRWFDHFTRITFLGRSLKSGQYVQENFAIHLQQLERRLAAQFGGPNANPTMAGDVLKLSQEGISGSRLVSSTATYSYHMFGLALDVNYTTCPYISPGAHRAFNSWIGKVANLVANVSSTGINWDASVSSPTEYMGLYDELLRLSNFTKIYFSFLEPQNESKLSNALSQCRFSPWNGFSILQAKTLIQTDLTEVSRAWKGSRTNPESIFKNGFLGLSRDFVKGMVESGLDWGARYGDIMHFDMRRASGIGSKIEAAKLAHMSATKARARALYTQSSNEDYFVPAYSNDEEASYHLQSQLEGMDMDTGEQYDEAPAIFQTNGLNEYNFNENYLISDEFDTPSGNEYNEPENFYNEDYTNYFSDEEAAAFSGFFGEEEDFVTDVSRAIRLNRQYAVSLGWQQYHDKLNDIVLPFSGMQNVSLGEEAFARAVAGWQRQQGISERDSDGVIGPKTWQRLKSIVGASITSPPISPGQNSLNITPGSFAGLPNFLNRAGNNYNGSSNLRHDQNLFRSSHFNETEIKTVRHFLETEGGIDSINAYDNQIVTWGIGFAGKSGNLMIALQKLFSRNENARRDFAAFGITLNGPGLQDLTITSNNRAYSGMNALTFWKRSANHLNAIIYLSQKYAVDTFIAQWETFKQIHAPVFREFQKSNYLNNITDTNEKNKAKTAILHAHHHFPGLNKPIFFQNAVSFEDVLRIYIEKSSSRGNFQHSANNWRTSINRIFGSTTNNESYSAFEQEDNTYSFKNNQELDQFINESSFGNEQDNYLVSNDNFITDLSKAIRLNSQYAISLGWNQYQDQINDLLLPLSGMQNVSLSEDAFAQALAAWQAQQGFSSHDADGVLGPKTWARMQPFLQGTPAAPNVPVTPSGGSLGNIAQNEWISSTVLQSKYSSWQQYSIKRNDVIRWGISNPATYIESAIQEWNANPGIQGHFNHDFDTDHHHSYINLKRLYQAKNISNPAAYFTANIVDITFLTRRTPAHRNLAAVLSNAQTSLMNSGSTFAPISAWSFVPRTFNDNINKLSNHALGTAIDINPKTNPHVKSSEEILVINAVCRSILPSGLLAESNPDTLKRASDYFRFNFNDNWINQQSQSSILNAARNRRSQLNKYATSGFLNLPGSFIRILQNAGLRWGGAWSSSKDFMHFEMF